MAGNERLGSSDLATWLSSAEVAELAGVTARSVRRACDEHRLEHHVDTVSGRARYMIEPAAADAWIRSRRRPERRMISAPHDNNDTGLLLELAMARGRITELELENATNLLAAERNRGAFEVRIAELSARLEHTQRDERRWRQVVAAMAGDAVPQAVGPDS